MRRILIVKGPDECNQRLKHVLAGAKNEIWEVEFGEEAPQIGPSKFR